MTEETLKAINVFEAFGDAAKSFQHVGMRPAWINFVGPGKIGKTRFLVEMMKLLRTIYFDADPMQGTKPYNGTFLVVKTYKKLEELIAWIEGQLATIKPELIILDTADGLYELIETEICKRFKTSDIWEVKVPGVGNGYSIAYTEYKNTISRLMALAPLLITITHTKDVKLGKSEILQQFKTQLNLPSGLQTWTHDACDANMWMSMTTSEELPEPFLKVSTQSTDPYRDFTGGSRNFPGLLQAKDEFALADYLVKTYKTKETENE